MDVFTNKNQIIIWKNQNMDSKDLETTIKSRNISKKYN